MPGELRALALANARYWPSVAPAVHRELARWGEAANAIAEPGLRELAMSKLAEEGFNAEVAATLATLAPAGRRSDAVQAIVALEVLYDLLDGLSEQVGDDPLVEGRRVFAVLLGAVGESASEVPLGGTQYTAALAASVRAALARLPRWEAIAPVARRTAARCAEAQVRIHAIPRLGVAQAREWAQSQAAGTGLGWRELLAGAASSVLAIHALIAVAARGETTAADGEAIAAAYLATGAVVTVLDSVVDAAEDRAAGNWGFVSLYEDPADIAPTLAATARRAAAQARALPDGAHHAMTLTGVVAYWTTAPAAQAGLAAGVSARLRHELSPTIWPAVAVMAGWRGAKRARTLVQTARGGAGAQGSDARHGAQA